MRPLLDTLFAPARHNLRDVAAINKLRGHYKTLTDKNLDKIGATTSELFPLIAATAVIAERILGEHMFDVQLRGTLALTRGSIAEMQTGEGKTLTAVPAITWLARTKGSVHVLTVNDYLARRDSQWMGEIYRRLGLNVSCIQQGMSSRERRAAYSADITYATANELGFDFLRDQIALHVAEQVHRGFNAAVIDEADSILIDEARIPLVIDRATSARGDGERGRVRIAEPSSPRHSALCTQRQERRARSGNRRPRRPAWCNHHLDQHGRSRH